MIRTINKQLPEKSTLLMACFLVTALVMLGFDFWPNIRFGYTVQICTGLLLFGLLADQMRVLLARLRLFGQSGASSVRMERHRWIGAASLLIFALHATSFSYGWTMALNICFIILAATGLMSRHHFKYRSRVVYLTQYGLHVTLGALCLALGVWHGVMAVIFE